MADVLLQLRQRKLGDLHKDDFQSYVHSPDDYYLSNDLESAQLDDLARFVAARLLLQPQTLNKLDQNELQWRQCRYRSKEIQRHYQACQYYSRHVVLLARPFHHDNH